VVKTPEEEQKFGPDRIKCPNCGHFLVCEDDGWAPEVIPNPNF
jgi:hypothetical protein